MSRQPTLPQQLEHCEWGASTIFEDRCVGVKKPAVNSFLDRSSSALGDAPGQKGRTLRTPFFFLLDDSFLGSEFWLAGLEPAAGVAASPDKAASPAGAVVPEVASPAAEPALPDAVAPVVPLVLGAIDVEDPGVTVSTYAPVAVDPLAPLDPTLAPTVNEPPGVSVSVLSESSGVKVGAPTRAAIRTSGPVFINAVTGRVSRLPRGRTVSCSFCMRAMEVGSG
jgi:hypothetical protein